MTELISERGMYRVLHNGEEVYKIPVMPLSEISARDVFNAYNNLGKDTTPAKD